MLPPFCALYESFERATCVLAQPQLPFSKFITEPWHTTGLTLSASVVSESSWGWPVASDYLLIGQRFRPAYQSGAKAYIWGAIHASQTCGRVIALLRLEILVTRTPRVYLRQPTVWKWLYATPDRTFRHQCRQQQDRHTRPLQGSQPKNVAGPRVSFPWQTESGSFKFEVPIRGPNAIVSLPTPIRLVLSPAHYVFQSTFSLVDVSLPFEDLRQR
jgi:hypothetical protein